VCEIHYSFVVDKRLRTINIHYKSTETVCRSIIHFLKKQIGGPFCLASYLDIPCQLYSRMLTNQKPGCTRTINCVLFCHATVGFVNKKKEKSKRHQSG
jgi:hypothetical protein